MNPTAPAIEPEDYRRLVGFKLLLLAILAVAAYLNSVNGWFPLYEDDQALAHALSGKAWFSPTAFADASLALNYAISGKNGWSYHALNILLQALAALALYGVVCRTLIRQHTRPHLQEAAPWLAFLSALLWLAHPLNTETVDYISRRGELLAGLFYLVTLYCVIRGAQAERGLLWYGPAVVACFAGMGSALTMVTAPLVVLLYDRIFLAESWRDLWRKRAVLYGGFVGCWVLFGASASLVGYDREAVGFIAGPPARAYAAAQLGVILHDLGLAFWPLGICFNYFDWPQDQPAASYLLPFAVIGALLAATVWALLRRPKIGFLGAWFFLTLAPTNLIPHADAAGDYRMYLPLAAVAAAVVLAGFALVVWVGERAPWAMYAGVGVALAAVIALGFATFLRNAQYETPLVLWEDTAAKRPGNVLAQVEVHLQRGNAYSAANQFDKAVAEYQAALDARPPGWNARLPSEHSMMMFVALKEIQVQALNNLMTALAGRQIADAADAAEREKAVLGLRQITDARNDADRAKALNDFGFLLWTKKQYADAARFFQEASRLEPETAKYYFNAALALVDNGDKEEAENERKEGLRLDSEWPQTTRRQAWEKATAADPRQRNAAQAIFLARQACQNDERRPEAWDALAAAYAAAGRFQDATEAAERALQFADGEHEEKLIHEIQQRLALYKDQKPFIQP